LIVPPVALLVELLVVTVGEGFSLMGRGGELAIGGGVTGDVAGGVAGGVATAL
jgi:hypothetical protein